MSKTIKLSLILSALLSQLNAEDMIILKPIAITSTAILTDELQSTDAVEVYTSQDIEKSHSRNIYEFLNTQTSLTTVSAFGNPFTQLIDIHGYGTSNGNQNIVITIDGRKLNNIDNSVQLLSSIAPDSIAKIEIIKSSGVVISGDGANAGVINITTKNNNEKNIGFNMGNYGLVDGSFYLGHSDEKISISASGEGQRNEGTRYIDDNGNRDESSFTTGTFNLGFRPMEALELRAGASLTNIDVTYASFLTQAQYKEDTAQKSSSFYPATHQKFSTKSISGGTTYDINDAFSINIDANHEYKTSDYIPSFGVATYNYNSLKTTLDYVSEIVSMRVGYDGFYGERKQSENQTSKDNNALFVMAQLYLAKSTFKAGYRYDRVSYEHQETTKDLKDSMPLHGAEFGYNYTFDKQSSLFVNYSHAYQAPNIDMFFSTTFAPPTYTPSTDFNAFIEPMISDNYTIGYNNINAKNKLKISAYYIDLKDEIYLYKAFIGDFGTNKNITKSHKYGLDLYDKYIVNQEFNLMLNYNYVQAIIDEEKEGTDDYAGKKLPSVSNHSAKVTLNYLPNKFATLTLSSVYRSSAYAADDFNNNFSQRQEAYNATNISATYAKDNWEVFAKINNLFNQANGLWIKDDAIYTTNFTTTAMVGFKLKY